LSLLLHDDVNTVADIAPVSAADDCNSDDDDDDKLEISKTENQVDCLSSDTDTVAN